MADEAPKVEGFRDFMRRSGWAALAVLFVVTGLGASIFAVWQSSHQKTPAQQNQLVGTKLSGYQPTSHIAKLRVADVKKGSGKSAKSGNSIVVNYVGALAASGIIFDDTYDSGQPVTFQLKQGSVIDGFYQGLLGMKVGGERQIYIPAKQAYGANPPLDSPIPANADLVFDVVLLNTQ